MPKISVLNVEGKEVGEINLSDSIFGIEPHNQSMYDAVIMQRASMRQGTHKTKTRSEVRGGGKRPWRQKGTGRARHGTIRSPLWVGGGVAFGTTPRKYGFRINKKVYRLALKSALSSKVLENNLVVLDDLNFSEIKTKNMVNVLNNLKVERKALFVTAEENQNVELSARNLPRVMTLRAKGINVLDVLNYDKLVVTKEAVAAIEEVLS